MIWQGLVWFSTVWFGLGGKGGSQLAWMTGMDDWHG